MRNLFLFVLILLSSCALAGKYENLDIQNKAILLKQDECTIEVEDTQIYLAMAGDCYFVKRNNSVHAVYYKEINSHVVLIVGDPLPKNPHYPLTVNRSDCGSTIKALMISGEKVAVSEKSFSNTVTCAGIGADEKEYYMLSH